MKKAFSLCIIICLIVGFGFGVFATTKYNTDVNKDGSTTIADLAILKLILAGAMENEELGNDEFTSTTSSENNTSSSYPDNDFESNSSCVPPPNTSSENNTSSEYPNNNSESNSNSSQMPDTSSIVNNISSATSDFNYFYKESCSTLFVYSSEDFENNNYSPSTTN